MGFFLQVVLTLELEEFLKLYMVHALQEAISSNGNCSSWNDLPSLHDTNQLPFLRCFW